MEISSEDIDIDDLVVEYDTHFHNILSKIDKMKSQIVEYTISLKQIQDVDIR